MIHALKIDFFSQGVDRASVVRERASARVTGSWSETH